MPWFWMPRITPPWRRTIWPQVMAILDAVSSCPSYSFLLSSSYCLYSPAFSLVYRVRPGNRGGTDKTYSFTSARLPGRTYFPVSNLKPQNIHIIREVGRDLLPLPIRRAFWLRWAGDRWGWTCRFPKVVRGRAGKFWRCGDSNALPHGPYVLCSRRAYLIGLSYRQYLCMPVCL